MGLTTCTSLVCLSSSMRHRRRSLGFPTVSLFVPQLDGVLGFDRKGELGANYTTRFSMSSVGDGLFAVCIGAEDVLLGNFTQALERRGIPWLTGAWVFDRVGSDAIFRSN